jgi:hypothetical protein
MRLVPNAESAYRRLIVLAPSDCPVPDSFLHVEENPKRHEALLAGIQRLRGSLYVQDGAIAPSQLTEDGRLRLAVDDISWHLLAVNQDGFVCGGARYREASNRIPFTQLGVAASSLAQSDIWGSRLRRAVDSDIALARRRDVSYVEFGGWAVAEELRCSVEALRIALGVYSLAQSLGGCVGISAATRRHHSSSILRRIGGRPLAADGAELPPYFDPQYGCEMEMLRFESHSPNPRYNSWIGEIRAHLQTAPVVRCKQPSPARNRTTAHIDFQSSERTFLPQ